MKWLKYLLLACLLLFCFSMHFTTSDDFNQDLGRHLKLGEIIVKTHAVPKTNLFSYTNPQFPFINHHWLSEVFFYLLVKLLGLNALIILKTLLILLSLIIIVQTGYKNASVLITTVIAVIFSPLLIDRSNIRPEIFGYLFFSILLYITIYYPQSKKLIGYVPLIMFFWVNIHISFVFGIFLVLLIFVKSLSSSKKKYSTADNIILLLSLIVLIINPNGIGGLLYPFSIFKNYGYTIVENQNLFYLNAMIFNPLIKYFFIISPLIIVSLILLLIRKKIVEFVLLIIFFTLTIMQMRHLPFFILAAIPTISIALTPLQKIFINRKLNGSLLVCLLFIVLMIIVSLSFFDNLFWRTFDYDRSFGLGFSQEAEKAAEFVKKNKLPKNIFNNFDIAGYLIYQLYPEYQFFVDNRPEAYPDNFMQNVYINMQLYKNKRDAIFEKNNVNTVVITHTDYTDWGKSFLVNIYNDPHWKVVYLDSTMIVLVKNTNLVDIRDNNEYLNSLISKESSYLKLLKLSRFFGFINNIDLATSAFAKAEEINPDSCSIKKIKYQQLQNPLTYYQAQEIRNNFWYCF